MKACYHENIGNTQITGFGPRKNSKASACAWFTLQSFHHQTLAGGIVYRFVQCLPYAQAKTLEEAHAIAEAHDMATA